MAGRDITTTSEYRLRRLIGAMWLSAFLIGVGYLIVPTIVTNSNYHFVEQVYESVGAPRGVYDVLGFQGRHVLFTVVSIAVLGLMAYGLVRTFRAMGPTLNETVLKKQTAIVAALMAVTFGMMLTNPWPFRTQSSGASRASSLVSQLQTVRSQLELYQVQHQGHYPPQDALWEHLTSVTNPAGDIITSEQLRDGTAGELLFGPYLQQPAVNPFTMNDSTVASDNSGAWVYNAHLGTFQAVVPGHKIQELQLADYDAVPAPVPWLDRTGMRVFYWRAVYVQPKPSVLEKINEVIGLPLKCGVAFCLLFAWLSRRYAKQPRAQNPYDFWMHRFAFTCLISFITLFAASLFLEDVNAATARLIFGYTFIWSLGGITYLLYLPHYQRAWSDGSACAYCGYDLTGTREAQRSQCPECGEMLLPLPNSQPAEPQLPSAHTSRRAA